MITDKANATLIEKEEINALSFTADEVLTSEEDQQKRASALKRATGLGNLEKHKVRITFKDSQGLKQVFTTLWGITPINVILKENRLIPIHCIVEVGFS